MVSLGFQTHHARLIWRSCLASAFRTALACTIVGCITLFSPPWLKHQIAFPAFSYVTVILIVTDATLGDTLRGCWNALCATILGVCPAFLILWLIGPARLTASSTAAVVGLSAFLALQPGNTHLVTKRIALGQIVIVYVLAFINGSHTDPIMHPVRVAASTAVGVVACVLALLLPYPALASHEVKKNYKLFTKNASERLQLFVKAFSAKDNISAQALIFQTKPLAVAGTKLLRSIKCKQESVLWERLPLCRILRPHCKNINPGEKLQELETPLRGMEIALSNALRFPVRILNSELKEDLASIQEHISRQVKSMLFASATVPESNAEDVVKFLQTLQTLIPLDQNDFPNLFFLFCLKLLREKSTTTVMKPGKDGSAESEKKEKWFCFKRIWRNLCSNINNTRLMPAFKCSLSLGLAVYLGSLYSKQNGFWAGLPVAISLAPAREATFKVANVKVQGTVLGTIYGVLGFFLFEKYVQIRLLSLVPWFIFCSFLRCSRMYGQAGGISAVIGAVLVLGRKNFGPPSEFAIARITETIIGLSCSIMVEILFQPTRASTLAKIQLSRSLQTLHDTIGPIGICTSKSNLEKSIKKLKLQVTELGKFIGEAEVEPNFWFLPFPSACYGKLLGSLSKMVEFLLFASHSIEIFEQESGRINNSVCKETLNNLDSDLKIFKDIVGSSIKCFEEVSLIKSLKVLDEEFERKKTSLDLESGKSSIPHIIKFSGPNEDGIEKNNMSSYLQHSKELVDCINNGDKGEKELKSQLVLCLSSLGYCMNSLVAETKEIEKAIKELVQWENPSSHVNLHDISCKIHALADTNNSK